METRNHSKQIMKENENKSSLKHKRDRKGKIIPQEDKKEDKKEENNINNINNINILNKDNEKKEENKDEQNIIIKLNRVKEDDKEDDKNIIEDDKNIISNEEDDANVKKDKYNDNMEEKQEEEKKIIKFRMNREEEKPKSNLTEDDDCECPNKCCIYCQSGTGCCLCLKKQEKCPSCKKEQYEEDNKKEEDKKEQYEDKIITHGRRRTVMEIPEIYKSQKIPLLPPDDYRIYLNKQRDLENGANREINPIFQNRNPRARLINIFFFIIYSLIFIFTTVTFRNANGFEYQSMTSLYIMILGIFVLLFAINIQNHFK